MKIFVLLHPTPTIKEFNISTGSRQSPSRQLPTLKKDCCPSDSNLSFSQSESIIFICLSTLTFLYLAISRLFSECPLIEPMSESAKPASYRLPQKFRLAIWLLATSCKYFCSSCLVIGFKTETILSTSGTALNTSFIASLYFWEDMNGSNLSPAKSEYLSKIVLASLCKGTFNIFPLLSFVFPATY